MHQTQYIHLINILYYEVAKATERSRVCLLKTASVTGKEYLLDLKTFLLLCLFTDQTHPRKLFRQQPEPDQAWCAFSPHVLGNNWRWTRSPPSKIGRATRAPLRQRLHAPNRQRSQDHEAGSWRFVRCRSFKAEQSGWFCFWGWWGQKTVGCRILS